MSDLTPPGALQVVPGTPSPAVLDTVTQGLLVPVQTDQRFRHFPSETYTLAPHSNLVRFMRALIGDAGAGQLRKRLVLNRLGQLMSSSYFYDLDSFYGALFGMQRAPTETLTLDPYNSTAAPDDWSAAQQSDSSYRHRLFQFGRALEYGPSPVGMKLIAEAILSVTCDIYESFLYADQLAMTYGVPFPGPPPPTNTMLSYYTFGGLQQFTFSQMEGVSGTVANSLYRKQFVISPHRPVSVVEANNVLAVIEQLKPADAIAVVLAQSNDVYTPVSVAGVWADSNYWEIRPAVTVTTTGATVPYGQAQPGTTVTPNVPPFSSYQGEQWFYNKDITGALAYVQDPMQNVLATSNAQRIVWADGTYTDYLPTNAPLPWWMAILGRYSQDGVMAINPLSGRGNLDANASASLSNVTFDGIDMDTLLQTISQQNTINNNFQLSSDSLSFWCTDYRSQDDPSRDILEIRFGTPHTINALSLDVAHFPSHISVEYYDNKAAGWFSLLQHDIVDSVPAVLPNNDDYLMTKIHPQHYGEDHWHSLSTKVLPTLTDRIRVVLTRRKGRGPAYSRITTQPGPNGGFATVQTAAPYSLAVRRLKVGYSVEGLGDLPVLGLPNQGVIDTGTDIMGSPVQYSLYMEHASGPIKTQPVRWRSSPQPLATSVVNFYLDVRTSSGAGQVIDRLLIDPTHLGVHATLYWSNSTPTASQKHTAQDIPLIYPASVMNGSVIAVPTGLQFPTTVGTTGNIDVSNTNLLFDPNQDWWVGVRFRATKHTGRIPIIDVRGIKIGHGDEVFLVNNIPLLYPLSEDSDFEGGTVGHWTGVYQCTTANTTAEAYTGTHSLRVTATAANGGYLVMTQYFPVTPGYVVDARAWVKPSVDGAQVAMTVWWYDAQQHYLGYSGGPWLTLSSNSWTQVPVYGAQPPANAAYGLLSFNFGSGSVGDYFDVDNVMANQSSISSPVVLPKDGYVHLLVGYTHATQTWTLAYQIGVNDEFDANPPVVVTRQQAPASSAPTYPNIRIGGFNDDTVASTAGMLLMDLVLKGETLTDATIADYMANPEPYSQKGSFNSQDQGKTANAYLRFDDDFISEENPSGLMGGPPTFYPSLFWTPVAGDYLLTTGYLVLPPTLAKFWKIEMTNLTPEPYEGFLPLQISTQTFPTAVVAASTVPSSIPGYAGPMDKGIPTLINLGQGENPYPYSGTGGQPSPTTASSLLMSPTQVMVSKDPAAAQQLGAASWVYNFIDYHQGMSAPRFDQPGFHTYATSDMAYTAKVAFFCGFNQIQAVRTSPLAQNDAPVYYEHFLDDQFIEENTFNQDPGDLWSPIDPESANSGPWVAQSVSFISTHDVTGVQFATSQTDAIQVVYDDNMQNTALASTSWKDVGTWHAVGDVAPAQVTYKLGANAIVFSRSSNPPPPAQGVAGAVHGLMNPPIEPPLKTFGTYVMTNVLAVEDQGFEGGTTGSWIGTGNSSVANSTAQAAAGTHSLAMTSTVTGDYWIDGPTIPVLPATSYTYELSYWAATAGRVVYAWVQWFDANNTYMTATVGPPATDAVGSWTSVSNTVVPPAGAVSARLLAYVTGAVLGEVHYIDSVAFIAPVPISTSGGSNVPYGGISSAPLLLSPRGRAWVAVRYTAITPLTSPLFVQLVDTVTGRLVWQAQTTGAPGGVVEFSAPYDISSVPNVNPADPLFVQLVQEGKSNDVISVDALSVFDEGIVWEFSNDGGTTFWQAIDSRNNPNGVLRFPVPSQQLVWRVTCYRQAMHVSALQIRPIYQGQLNMDAQPFMRGPNLSTYDTTPDVYSDPMFQQWNNAVARWWFLAFKQYPNLFPDGVPITNAFSSFYSRTTTDDLSLTLTDSATASKTARPPALEFFPAVTDSATWVQGHFTRVGAEDLSGTFTDAVSFYVAHPDISNNLIQPPGGNKIIT